MPPARSTCSNLTRHGALPTTTCGAAGGGRQRCWRKWRRRAMLTEMRKARLLTPRPVAASVDELLAGATERHPFAHSDSKSGVGFERVTIDGKSHVLKHVHIDNDWTMRFFHETTCIPLEVWRVGLMDVLPER